MKQHLHQHYRGWISATAAAVATGLVGTLLTLTLGTASAMPRQGDPPVARPPRTSDHGGFVEHGCFITPHNWSEPIAGPLPRCYTYVP